MKSKYIATVDKLFTKEQVKNAKNRLSAGEKRVKFTVEVDGKLKKSEDYTMQKSELSVEGLLSVFYHFHKTMEEHLKTGVSNPDFFIDGLISASKLIEDKEFGKELKKKFDEKLGTATITCSGKTKFEGDFDVIPEDSAD